MEYTRIRSRHKGEEYVLTELGEDALEIAASYIEPAKEAVQKDPFFGFLAGTLNKKQP